MKKTYSAGGVVINSEGNVLVVNQNDDSWSLPKGHIDPGETPQDAAVREIKEESGISELELIDELGTYERHRIGKDGKGYDTSELKNIKFFLFKTNQLKLAPEDPQNPEAQWIAPQKVAALLTHPKDKAFFEGSMATIFPETS
ncbi:MAG TPA: NUDIX domain-containing protein [Candidatus Saccharimonadales bacterium]|nr:NUDIX domain-containing protein [Candidatus Saccharimonadales bacterium]